MAYAIHRRRVTRAERSDEAVTMTAARRVVADGSPATGTEIVDIPALHRSLAAKKVAIPILVAFARELAGTAHLQPAPSSPGERSGSDPSTSLRASTTGEIASERQVAPARPVVEPPPSQTAPRVQIHHERGMEIVIDSATGGLADSAIRVVVAPRR